MALLTAQLAREQIERGSSTRRPVRQCAVCFRLVVCPCGLRAVTNNLTSAVTITTKEQQKSRGYVTQLYIAPHQSEQANVRFRVPRSKE